MTSSALRHYVGRAIETLAPRLESAFPACFDWPRLCRDTPAVAERSSAGVFDAADATAAHEIQDRSDALFRLAHVALLAVLSAVDPSVEDPDAALAAFGIAPDDEEEQRFEVLALEVLDAVEESFEDEGVDLDERGAAVRELVVRGWDAVQEIVDDSGLLARTDGDGEEEDAEACARSVLGAIVRLAVVLAAMRWLARYPDADGSDD